MILSKWWDKDTTPVHLGVYEVDDDDGSGVVWYAYWNGIKFCYRDYDPHGANYNRYSRTCCDRRVAWRGVLREEI